MILTLIFLQAISEDIQPNIAYDIIKQLITVGAIIYFMSLFFKSRQKEIDTKASTLAKDLELSKAETKEKFDKLEKKYEDLEAEMKEFRTNYLSRFDELKKMLGKITTRLAVFGVKLNITEKIEEEDV